MNLSRFFSLAEMCHSNTAVAERIPNLPGDGERGQLTALCTQVLDPLREAVGQTVRVNSGYRGPALNARLRGSTTSQHMKGQAADIQTAAVSVLELFKMVIRLGLPFDQVIFEAKNATSKWVHVSHNPAGNRGEIRVAEFDASGKPVRYPQVSAEQALAMVDRVTRSSRPGQWPDYHETSDEPEHAAMPAAAVPAGPAPVPAPPAAPPATTAPVKKVPAKKSPAEKAPAKKAPAKKAPAKTAAKKTATAKKALARKLTADKLPLSKAAAKVASAKSAPSKKAPAKKVPAKKAPAKQAPAKQAPMKGLATKKAPGKKAATKRSAGR